MVTTLSAPSIYVSDIVAFISSNNFLKERKDVKIKGFKPISSAGAGEMTYCSASGEKGLELVNSSKASLVICPSTLRNKITQNKTSLIFVDNPRLWFIRCMKQFTNQRIIIGVHPTSIVKTKQIGKNVYIGPFAFIEENVTIGDNAIIHGGVHIINKTAIGNNVTIDSSTVIGHDGFGYEKDEKQQWEKFPHIGGVSIGDNVDIGANVCIDRGTLGNTIIGEGTRIDNLVHIAHNVQIGTNCIIIAQTFLGGSCILEDNAYVGACASVRDGGVRIGKNALVGMGAVVTKDVPPNTTVIGVPAKPIKRR